MRVVNLTTVRTEVMQQADTVGSSTPMRPQQWCMCFPLTIDRVSLGHISNFRESL